MFSPFLAIQASRWPILLSIGLFSATTRVLGHLNGLVEALRLFLRLWWVGWVAYLWWKDLSKEGLLGYHSSKLEVRLRSAMLLFILSEAFFFLSFFWAFYDFSLSPTIEIGLMWPPMGVQPLSAYSIPLLNTVILLSSGITVTWAHHTIVEGYYFKALFRLGVTVSLGVYFIFLQGVEYREAGFSIADSCYGSIFFMGTGFHGLHVIIGARFLLVVFLSLKDAKLLFNHHFSFEAAAWYWHFVDVVWLVLFISIYWWGAL